MDRETAQWIVIAIATVGFVTWLSALAFMIRVTRERRARVQEAAVRFEIENTAASGTVVGEAEVAGQPDELSETLARLLAREGMGPLGPVKIVTCSPREVVFEASGVQPGSSSSGQTGVRGGRFRLNPIGSRTRIEYAIQTSNGMVLLGLGWLFVVLGLAALVGACTVAFGYIVPNPNVRAQAFQVMQVVHFLWPPFLFGSLSRQPARFARARVEAMVHNLPYSG